MGISETELLQQVLEQLKKVLPQSWQVGVSKQPGGKDQPDLLVELRTPDGQQTLLVVQAKASLEPRDVPGVVEQVQKYAATMDNAATMVVAPFISPRTQGKLKASGVGYWDATSNANIAMEQPALFVQIGGADRNPWPDTRSLQSLRGPAAGRVVRALCDFRPPYGIRELAERAGVSPASLSRVIELLGGEDIVKRSSSRGPVAKVDWLALIRRWTDDYAFATSNRTASYLEPRGLKALLGRLPEQTFEYAVTGTLAADALGTAVSAPRLAVIFVREMAACADALKLRPAESGGNVLLAEPFDPVALERTISKDGVTYAAPSQIAADLLTGPGRSPADGEALLAWMKENEDVWRP